MRSWLQGNSYCQECLILKGDIVASFKIASTQPLVKLRKIPGIVIIHSILVYVWSKPAWDLYWCRLQSHGAIFSFERAFMCIGMQINLEYAEIRGLDIWLASESQCPWERSLQWEAVCAPGWVITRQTEPQVSLHGSRRSTKRAAPF